MAVVRSHHLAKLRHKALLASLALVLALHALVAWVLQRSGGLSHGVAHAVVGAGPEGAAATVLRSWQVKALAPPSGPEEALPAQATEATAPTAEPLPPVAPIAHDEAAVKPSSPATPALGVLVPTDYLPPEQLDQSARPVEEWVLDEPVLMAVRKARLHLKVWVSASGVVDGVDVLSAEPAGDWSRQAIQSLPLTVMHPGMKDGRAVPSMVVVEIASEDLGYR